MLWVFLVVVVVAAVAVFCFLLLVPHLRNTEGAASYGCLGIFRHRDHSDQPPFGATSAQVELQRRLDSEKKRQREIVMQKSKEIMSLKRSAMK